MISCNYNSTHHRASTFPNFWVGASYFLTVIESSVMQKLKDAGTASLSSGKMTCFSKKDAALTAELIWAVKTVDSH